MTSARRCVRLLSPVLPLLILAGAIAFSADLWAGPPPESYWNVDDIRPGMKGTGRTVMKGTKVETFQAEVLGVLKNTSPGRDMVLCRLSGLDLDKTGVIAGMSGSPVYFDGKLLGAVAYAWPYGKEPIAGVTPFSQMHGFVEAHEQPRRRRSEAQADPGRPGGSARTRRPHLRQRHRRARPRRGRTGRGRTVDDSVAHAPGGYRLHAAQPAVAARPHRRHRSGARARRRRRQDRRRSAGGPARTGRTAGRRPHHRRFRPVRHRHRHAHRGGARLWLGPSLLRRGRLRIPSDDRLHPYHLPASDGELQNGLAAAHGRPRQRRREHLHCRLARARTRHAAGVHERHSRRRKEEDLQCAHGAPALPSAAAGLHGADQLRRYGG